MSELSKKYLQVEMDDRTQWCVPVMLIARNRAENYKEEFGGSLERSLNEDTIPLFEEDEYEIVDWAANNMNWEDVEEHAEKIGMLEPPEPDYQEGWVNGRKSFLTGEPWEAP